MGHKSGTFNGNQLALFSMGLMRNLFPRPTGRGLLVDNHNDETTTLYLDEDYYNSLISAMDQHRNDGAFARSNSEAEWNNLHEKFKTMTASKEILDHLRPHFMSE
jgi:hypothetical protein